MNTNEMKKALLIAARRHPEALLRPLTEPEKRALKKYIRANGRSWKSELNLWWQNPGTITDEDMRLLYCLRNTHGPTWLVKFKFPKVFTFPKVP